MKRLQITVAPDQAGQRLDILLHTAAPQLSRAALQKAVQAGNCRVDDVPETRCRVKARAGQTICLLLPDTENSLQAEHGALQLLWHDEHLAVCNKPAGLTVHPCPSCPRQTLVQRLLGRFPQLRQQEGLRPGIVHRLDKDTSGLLVVALTEQDRLAMSAAFAERSVSKEYLALVVGQPPAQGQCVEPLGRHPTNRIKRAVVAEACGGRPATTCWRTLWTAPDMGFSLLAVRILTGRTHQIRVHMAHLGHPLLGDKLYAPKAVQAMAPRQMLHAWQISFTHPATGKVLQFTCPPPPDLPQSAIAAARRMQRVVITGNPGSGKSSLTSCLAQHGIPTVSADGIVQDLYAPGGEGSQWLAQMGKRELLTPQGGVQKEALLAAMRQDVRFRREMENAIHAMVRAVVEDFWQAQERLGSVLAVAEVPLYFESGWDQVFTPSPIVVAVRCPLSVRAQRLEQDRGWDTEKTAALEAWQWPEDRKLKAAQIIVDNTGSPKALELATEQLLATLEQQRQQEDERLGSELAALWA